MKPTKIVTCIIIFIIGVSSAFGQFSFDNYALCHLNIVDVNAKKILEDYTIVIQNGKIQNILPSKDYMLNDSVQSIVLRNKFVVPGLIDAHVHFATDPTEERGARPFQRSAATRPARAAQSARGPRPHEQMMGLRVAPPTARPAPPREGLLDTL